MANTRKSRKPKSQSSDNSNYSMTNFFGPVSFTPVSRDEGESILIWLVKLIITTVIDLLKIFIMNIFSLVFSMIAFIPNRIVPKVIDILSETLTGKLILLYLGIFFFGLSLLVTDMALTGTINFLNYFNASGAYLVMLQSCSDAIQTVLVNIVYMGKPQPSATLSADMWSEIFKNYNVTGGKIGIGLVVAELAGRWARDLDPNGDYNVTRDHLAKAFEHLKQLFPRKNP